MRFIEQIINNPKSLSVVASQNPAVADALDAVLGRQGDELGRYYAAVAVTRIGGRANQRDVGGLSVEVARVTHYTSREADPHRHIHLMLNTRVQRPDGAWHGLYSAALRQHIGATNALAHQVLISDPALRVALASQGLTLGDDGEINEARSVVAAMSKRSAELAIVRDALEAAWRAEHPDRAPNTRVRHGWDRAAWEQTRKAKGAHESIEQSSHSARIRDELGVLEEDFGPGTRARWLCKAPRLAVSIAMPSRPRHSPDSRPGAQRGVRRSSALRWQPH